MKNEGILKSVEIFKQKIEQAHNSNSRSQDVLNAIRELLENIGANIPNGEAIPSNVQQEILQNAEQLIKKD